MRWPLALVLVAACGGSSTPSKTPTTGTTTAGGIADPAAPPSELLGKPVWDGPLTDPMAKKLVARVQEALADAPPKLTGADPRMWQGPISMWIERRVKLGREIRADVEAIATDKDPRMHLLAAVALGIATDDLVYDLLAIEMPAEAVQGEFGAEAQAVFKDVLEEQALPVAGAARQAMKRCIEVAPRAPQSLQVWAEYCRERDGKLGELETRVGARDSSRRRRPPEAKPPALFSDCDSKENLSRSPRAPAPDRKAKPVVAFVYTGSQLADADARKLEEAVAAKLGKDTGMPVIEAKEMADARKLVAQKKLHARAPVCGQAPPLPAVIAHTRKHLVLGEISTTCIYEMSSKTERCGLMVEFNRAGVVDNEGLPKAHFAQVKNLDVPIEDWVAAAGALAPDKGADGILGSLSQGKDSSIFFSIKDYSDDDPWLRVGWTLQDETKQKLQACVDGAGSFDATFTITKEGKTKAVALKPVTAPAAGSKLDACVKQALEATPWPCTQNGKPAKVSVRMCVAPRPN